MIVRNSDGILDFCLDKMEDIDADPDMDITKKTKQFAIYLKEIRGMMSLNIQHKKLVLQAPDIARSQDIVLTFGSKEKAEKLTEEVDAKEAFKDAVKNMSKEDIAELLKQVEA